nr:MAG TPA: Prokaryotic membrane lipoprotein lipid attachment site [Caudoviricetes sp.]
MKKILFVLALIFSLTACCTEEEIQKCEANGRSRQTCLYLLCR